MKLNVLAAIIGICLLTGWALYLGFDGVLYMASIAVISGLGGYIITQDIRNGLFDDLLNRLRK